MSVKQYFSDQFHFSSFSLEHEFTSDFYISCWQKNRAVLPFLCFRVVLFLLCFSVLISSMVITGAALSLGFWFIYMTHWGVLLITITNGFAVAVSVRAYLKGPIEGTFGLPWYVKTYWILYNSTIPIALFITIFYFSFLNSMEENIEVMLPLALDYFVHLINSIIMLLLLLFTRHPTKILHFYWPLLTGVIYMFFSLIYYYAGGLDPSDRHYIYPMLDWSNPGPTAALVVVCTVAIILMHCFVAALAAARDVLSWAYTKSSQSISIVNNY